ncbi:MAG: GMC family oxidoreductase [Chitinophagales bacterium]
MASDKTFDYIVIGSGFGGSVSAMRLAEKGYSVLVIEKGKWWKSEDFPKSNWNLPKFLWLPPLRWWGIMKMDFFKEVLVLSGAGVGGGSLVYANTHMIPKEAFWTNPIWSDLKNWKEVMAPYYEKARFMLGSSKYQREFIEDKYLKEVADDMGRSDSYKPVDYVGVYFGDTAKEKDPYFKGLGPMRKGCTECAGCMVGCRENAKNTLDKNYLYFAQDYGAEILAETLVNKIEYVNNEYVIHTESQTSFFSKNKQTFRSKGLVVSGGVLGTLKLLLEQKLIHKTLPNLSDKIGENILTNSEMIAGVGGSREKLNHGIAISRVFNPDDNTHIELCKYPDGSGAMMRLGVFAAGPGNGFVRTAKMLGNMIKQPVNTFRFFFETQVARNSIVLLIMQSLPNAMKLQLKKGLFGTSLKFDNKDQMKVPSYIPVGQDALHRYAKKSNAVAMNAFSEVMFNMSTTAHILGGNPMGKSPKEGVVDEYFRVHGYPNMYILDGSIVPANLGVNPSFTITALSEYAMDHIPVKEGFRKKTLEERLAEISA